MTREDFWVSEYKRASWPTIAENAAVADTSLAEYDKRFSKRTQFGLDDLPSAEELNEGVWINGFHVSAVLDDATFQYRLFVRQGTKTACPRYTNARNMQQLHMWIKEQGEENIKEAAEELNEEQD